MAQLRAKFVDRCAADGMRLRELARTGGNGREVQTIVHGLAGAGTMFGFPGVTAAASLLDDTFASGRSPTSADMDRLLSCLAEVGSRGSRNHDA